MDRYEELKSYVKQFPRVIIAFSGGIDSYFVLKASLDALGKDNVLAVTGDSPSLKETEKSQTSVLAENVGAIHKVTFTEEMGNPDYYNNPENRCFFCKDELYSKLNELKEELHYNAILDGTNYDDLSDYRPGYQASKNHSINSPLADLKFTKEEIRALSKQLGLEIWNKPSSPCLSSRIPYGQQVTKEKLSMIEQAEKIIESFGFREFRVRHFEFNQNAKTIKLAKLDIAKNELDNLMNGELFEDINKELRSIGYDFVTIDLGGLKSGSLNVKIELPEKLNS
jgi:pyridinium-3,5-biscarboxylic acid mononucleotide sulfurtransferase